MARAGIAVFRALLGFLASAAQLNLNAMTNAGRITTRTILYNHGILEMNASQCKLLGGIK